MMKLIALIMLVSLRFLIEPSAAQSQSAPFEQKKITKSEPPAKLVNFTGSIKNKNVILAWDVEKNETADQFQVEKSYNGGKLFKLAGLVFSTERPDIDSYRFFEKRSSHRDLCYRIKVVSKDHQSAYSDIVTIRS
jgi:hypothetical protein